MRKLTSHARASYDKAEAERKLVRDWLIALMITSPQKNRTKADLCAEAMLRFRASKNSFDAAWIGAIAETGNTHWYDPLPKAKKTGKARRVHRAT